MSSPFNSFKEFSEAEGAIYTFANNPTLIGILIILSALVFLYFIYASFSIKKGQSTAKNPGVLGLLIAASAFSLAESAYTSYIEQTDKTVSQKSGSAQVTRLGQGLGPQGLMAGMGMTIAGSTIRGRRGRRSPYGSRTLNSVWSSLRRIPSRLFPRLRSRQTPAAQRRKR